ncbi:MAG: AAA family ATPase [Kiritimatiellae bacterium]|nr:AAA family ATPase [Kiritimatiellia bacterium]
MEERIIGRDEERAVLRHLLDSNMPEFLALYGRRRVGKTFLINEYFESKARVVEVVGTVDTPMATQLARFAVELSNKFPAVPKDTAFGSWEDALESLIRAVDAELARDSGQRIVLFFDEVPWLDVPKAGFLSALSYLWNKHLCKSRYGNVLTVVCGSAASWMIRNVINNKGGLHNRVTRTIRLEPFDLVATKRYLESRQVLLPNQQIIELYMVLGGIPAYLRHVEPGLSAAQIVNRLCFGSGAQLGDEFDRLYRALFDRHQSHLKIVRALAASPKGLTRAEVVKRAGLSEGGDCSLFLKELKESGFVAWLSARGKRARGRVYRLIDEYSLFHLRWIEPAATNSAAFAAPDYWLRRVDTPSWHAWAGCAFEDLCLKNIHRIKHELGISGVSTTESTWSCPSDPASGERGAQVDLVIDRADRTVNLCEIKFLRGELELTADDKEALDRRKRAFSMHAGKSVLVLTTLITSQGVKKNRHYYGTVDSDLTADCLFAEQ